MTAKAMFVVARMSGLTRDECLGQWGGEKHCAIVKTVPGLRKWVLNKVVSEEDEGMPDGIGELWFTDKAALQAGMESAEMGAAIEDAKRFLDMERTYAVVVDEETVIG